MTVELQQIFDDDLTRSVLDIPNPLFDLVLLIGGDMNLNYCKAWLRYSICNVGSEK